jgi:hypothetical protein
MAFFYPIMHLVIRYINFSYRLAIKTKTTTNKCDGLFKEPAEGLEPTTC